MLPMEHMYKPYLSFSHQASVVPYGCIQWDEMYHLSWCYCTGGFLATICLACWNFSVICVVWLPSEPRDIGHMKPQSTENREKKSSVTKFSMSAGCQQKGQAIKHFHPPPSILGGLFPARPGFKSHHNQRHNSTFFISGRWERVIRWPPLSRKSPPMDRWRRGACPLVCANGEQRWRPSEVTVAPAPPDQAEGLPQMLKQQNCVIRVQKQMCSVHAQERTGRWTNKQKT